MAQSFQVFCFFKWFWKSRFKKYIAPLILKNHVDGHCAACDHTGRPGSCLLCVCKEAMGVIWQWVLGSFDFGHPSAVRREGPTASGDPRDVLSSSAPLPVEVLELHSRTYTSSPFIVLKYIFNAFLELTVINRVDRHVLKVFKKFFSLMAFLPAKGLGAGAMECVCVGGPHLKRRKKENWIWTRHWKLAILSMKGFSHYRSFHHKLPSQCSCWIYNRI